MSTRSKFASFNASIILSIDIGQLFSLSLSSKRAFMEWVKNTSLPYHLQFDPENISSQTIWEATDGITEKQIHKAQELLINHVLKVFPTNLSQLHLDYTNYFTFIDSMNERCTICKRGHNKQKRNDLRQFSMAMLTSYNLQIPLIWKLYEGNKNDKKEFSDFTSSAAQALSVCGISSKDVILTFDDGSNSAVNFSKLPFGFICAHTMTGFSKLFDIDLSKYKEITIRNVRSRKVHEIPSFTFSGGSGKGILTFSRALYDGQMMEKVCLRIMTSTS